MKNNIKRSLTLALSLLLLVSCKDNKKEEESSLKNENASYEIEESDTPAKKEEDQTELENNLKKEDEAVEKKDEKSSLDQDEKENKEKSTANKENKDKEEKSEPEKKEKLEAKLVEDNRDKDEDLDVKSLIGKIDEASKNLEKLKMSSDILLEDPSDSIKETMDTDIKYDENGDYQEVTMEKLDRENARSKIVYTKGNEVADQIMEEDPETGKTTLQEVDIETFDLNPDYMDLIKILKKMENDLDVSDEGEYYLLSLNSQNIDLVGLFEKEYYLSVGDIKSEDLDKKLEIKVSKENFYLENLDLVIVPTLEGYEGSKMQVKTSCTDFEKFK